MKISQLLFIIIPFLTLTFSCQENDDIYSEVKTEVVLPENHHEKIDNPLIVYVLEDGEITVNSRKCSLEEVEKIILDSISENKLVHLYGDQIAQYKYVYKIINICQKNYLKVSLMADEKGND